MVALITLIVIVVFAIFQIALFAKLWAMTKNVKDMADKMESQYEPVDYVRIAIVKGDKDKAVQLLTEALARDIVTLAAGDRSKYSSVSEVKDAYTPLFEKLGVFQLPITDIKDTKDIEKMMPYFN